MSQTIREQIRVAMDRGRKIVYDGYARPMIKRAHLEVISDCQAELYLEFPADAIAVTDANFDEVARQRGYVKVDDYEALKAKVADLEATLDQIETESRDFHGIAVASGYIKRDPDKVQVSRASVENWLNHLRELHSIEKVDEKRYVFHNVADAWIHGELTAALEGNYGQG